MLISFFLAAATATAPVPAMTTDWWSAHYDTPTKGLAPGEISLVVAEITVTRHGGFGGCVGRVYMGNPQMGPYVCSRLKKRAKFKPARTADGTPVVGVYRKMITVANVREEISFRAPKFGIWVPALEGSVSESPFEIQYYLSAEGRVSDCSLVEAVGINLERRPQLVDPRVVARACAEVMSQLKPVPPRDRQGLAVPSVQNALVISGGTAGSHN